MTSDIIIKFNRETAWVATGVVGVVIFAAVLLAVQERDPGAAEAVKTGTDLFLNTNPAVIDDVIAKGSSDKMTSDEPASNVESGSGEAPAEGSSILTSPAEVNRQAAQQNTSSWPRQISQNLVQVRSRTTVAAPLGCASNWFRFVGINGLQERG